MTGASRKLSGKEEALLVATVCSSPPEGRARWTLEIGVLRSQCLDRRIATQERKAGSANLNRGISGISA